MQNPFKTYISLSILILVILLFSEKSFAKTNNQFKYGIASGDPRENSFVIWTKINSHEEKAEVKYQISNTKSFKKVILEGSINTNKSKDFTVKKTIKNLKEGKDYYYRFIYKKSISEIGETITLPKNLNHFRLAFASCQNYSRGVFSVYKHILEDNPDVIVMLGDYIYEYPTYYKKLYDSGVSPRFDDTGVASNLALYRKKYQKYLTDPYLKEARRKKPLISIWDDHEIKNNHSGKEMKKNDTKRLYDAYQAYFEYLPITNNKNYQIYRNFKVGNLIDLYMIDGRQYRDKNLGNSRGPSYKWTNESKISKRDYLGEKQKSWLINGVNKSDYTWKVIGNNTLMMELDFFGSFVNFDAWEGFDFEKQQILKSFYENKTNNIFIFSGDIHSFFHGDLFYNNRSVAKEFSTTNLSSPLPNFAKRLFPLVPFFFNNIKYTSAEYSGYTLADFNKERLKVYLNGVDHIFDGNNKKFLLKKFTFNRN